jgi:CRISPR-associated protein (Cas_Csd1)
LRIAPPPKGENLSIWRCLIEAAVQHKSENIPPNLAGEWLRAILTGARYPLTLKSTVLIETDQTRAAGTPAPRRPSKRSGNHEARVVRDPAAAVSLREPAGV